MTTRWVPERHAKRAATWLHTRLGYVLAVTACAVLMTSGCGGSGSTSQSVNAGSRTYSATPANAAALLASLRVPTGFRRIENCPHLAAEAYTFCFTHRRSIVLNSAVIRSWAAGFGASLQTGTIDCSSTRLRRSRLISMLCTALATRDGERLEIQATSLVAASGTAEVGTTRDIRRLASGTQLHITDLGTLR
jgi:hypothetical protein